MKKLLILVIATAMTWATYAQTNATLEETGDKPHVMVEKLFGLLDQTPITTKRLWDRAIDFLPLDDYNGRYLSDSTNVDINKFGYLYAMLNMSITDNVPLPRPDAFYNYKVPANAPIPIAAMLQRYNYIKQTAISNNLLRLNSNERLEDVPNRPQNPYGEDTLFAATPIVQYFNGNAPEMILPFGKFVSNISHISNISIDFGYGPIAINFDQVFTPDLQSGMNQKAVLKITLANGRILRSRFIYHVANADGSFRNGPDLPYSSMLKDSLIIKGTKSFTGDDGTKFANARVSFYYSCTDKKLRKPLIVLDGFNADGNGNAYKALDVVGGYNLFEITPLSTPNKRALAKELRKEGYDLIFVDWLSNNGNDFIQRNAFLLQHIIDTINIIKRANGSIEKNMMIGYSMGGVIGKYAILDFEKNNPTAADGGHDIGKFFSYDGPLQGANIPLAGQAMLHDLGNIESKVLFGITLKEVVPALGNNLKLLESPAGQQLLIYQYRASDALSPSKHIAFYNEINAMGKIKKCDFLTISNGSVIGIENFPASTNLLTWDFSKKINLVKKKGITLRMDLWVDALPDGTTSGTVSKTQIYDRNLNWWLLINKWTPLVSTKNHVKYHVKGAIRPLDSCPGGTTNLFASAAKQLIDLGGTVNLGMYVNADGSQTQVLRSTFIPVVSALDLRSPERGLDFTPVTTEPIVEGLASSGSVRMVGSRNIAAFDFAVDGSPGEVRIHNQNHIAMSYRTSARLLHELIKYSPITSNSTATNLELSDKTYNFGVFVPQLLDINNFKLREMNNIIDYPLVVRNTGRLWVNRNGRVAYTDVLSNPNNFNLQNTPYNLFIRKTNVCQNLANVTLQNGGSMIVGEISGVSAAARVHIEKETFLDVANGGLLTIDQASQVQVKNDGLFRISGGTLNTNFNSRVIVENGANMKLESGIANLAATTQMIVQNSGIATTSGGQMNLTANAQVIVQGGGILNLTGGTLFLRDASQIIVQSGGILNITGGTLSLHDASQIIVQSGGKVIITGGLSSLLATSQLVVEQGGIVEVKTDAALAITEQSIFDVRGGKATFQDRSSTTISGKARLQTTGEVRFNTGQLTLRDEGLIQANDHSLLVFNSEMYIYMRNLAAIDVVQKATLRFDGSAFATVRFRGGSDTTENTPIRLRGCKWIINAPMAVSGSVYFQVINDPSITYLNNLGFNLKGDGKRLNTPFRVLELMGVDFDIVNVNIQHGKIIYQDHSSLGYKGGSFFTDVYFEGGNPDGQGVAAIINNNDIADALNISNCLFDNVDHCVKIQAHPTLISGDINIVSTTATRFKSLGFDFLLNGNINIRNSHFIASERASDLATSGGSHFAPALRVRDMGSLRSTVVSNTVIESTVDWQHYPQWAATGFDPTHDYSESDPIYPPQNDMMRDIEDSYLVGLFNVVDFQLNNASEVRGGYIGILTDMGEADGSPIQNNVSISCSSVHDNYTGIVMINIKDPTSWGSVVFGGLYLDAATIDDNVFGIYGRNIFIDANLTATRLPNTFGILNGTGHGHYMCIHYSTTTAPNGPLSGGVLLAPNNFWSSGAPVMNVNYLLNGSSINAAPAAAMSSDCVPNERHSTDPTATMASATDEQKAFITVNGVTKALLPLYWKGISEYLNSDIADARATLSEITAIPTNLILASDNPYLRSYHTLAWAIAPGPAVSDIGNQKIVNIKNTNPMFVFPNPAEGFFKLVLPSGRYDVQLSDVLGRVIKQVQVADYEEISTENIESGLYQITVRKKGEQAIFQTGKIVIKE